MGTCPGSHIDPTAVLSTDSEDLVGWTLEEGAGLVTLGESWSWRACLSLQSLFSVLSWFSKWQSSGCSRGLLSDLTLCQSGQASASFSSSWNQQALRGIDRSFPSYSPCCTCRCLSRWRCGAPEPQWALESYRGLAMSSRANHFASLSLGFFICKMGIIIGPTS